MQLILAFAHSSRGIPSSWSFGCGDGYDDDAGNKRRYRVGLPFFVARFQRSAVPMENHAKNILRGLMWVTCKHQAPIKPSRGATQNPAKTKYCRSVCLVANPARPQPATMASGSSTPSSAHSYTWDQMADMLMVAAESADSLKVNEINQLL